MNLRIWACAALVVALLACATAQAAPVTVNLRVEGSSSTIFEGPVTTDGKEIDKGDGPHPCDGTNGGANPAPVPTMTAALDDAPIAGGLGRLMGPGVRRTSWCERIGGEAQDPANPLLGLRAQLPVPATWGAASSAWPPADQVLFTFDSFGKPLLRLDGPARVGGRQARPPVTVTDGDVGAAARQARRSRACREPAARTGGCRWRSRRRASATLKAERAGSVRSNTLEVCVEQPGRALCDVRARRCRSHASARAATPPRRSHASAVRVNGRKYRRGPRLLKGTVGDDPSGIREVKIALRRHVRGRSCQWWSGRRERFVGTHCKKVFFFAIGSNRNWSYLLPRALPPGRYVLDVKAFDGRRNRDEKFVSGKNRVEFEVVPRSRGTTATARRALETERVCR